MIVQYHTLGILIVWVITAKYYPAALKIVLSIAVGGGKGGGQSLRGSSDHLPIHPKLIIKMKEPETAVSPSLGLISVAYCMCGVLIVFGMTGC